MTKLRPSSQVGASKRMSIGLPIPGTGLQKKLLLLRKKHKVPEVKPPTVFGNPPVNPLKTKKKAVKTNDPL